MKTNRLKEASDNPTKPDFADFPYTLALLSDAKCDMLCAAIDTFCCTVREQSLSNLIEKICFLHYSIILCLTQEPVIHTMCQSKDGEKKMHPIDTTEKNRNSS